MGGNSSSHNHQMADSPSPRLPSSRSRTVSGVVELDRGTRSRFSSSTRAATARIRRFLPLPPRLVSVGHRLGLASKKHTGASGKQRLSSVGASVSTFGVGVGRKSGKSRNRDHCRIFRDLISTWQLRDLHCLVVEFEASLALRELSLRADSARPPASTLRDDLYRLHQTGTASDLTLTYEGVDFHVHRSFLSKRCSYFRRLFRQHPPSKRRLAVNFSEYRTRLNLEAFTLLLEYLYTGEVSTESKQNCSASSVQTLLRFRDEIETVRMLEDDLSSMCKNPDANDANAVLIFSNSNRMSAELNETLLDTSQSLIFEQQRHCRFKCHSSILSARSTFFRHLIEKRQNDVVKASYKEEINAEAAPSTSKQQQWSGKLLEIVLDESVIPRQYAPVLLHALYTDQIDMSLIIRGCLTSSSCLTEVQAIASGKCQVSPIDEATEIYQIARFLEFSKLAQGCEDFIVSHISLDSLPAVYNWSIECYGSSFVRRHCVNFLCQEFVRVASTTLLFDLEESLLVDALNTDFVQASELEILNAVVRWGEHQLVRRLEEREPNILVGTTHSISRKGVRRSDLSDDELRDVLGELIPLIRKDYILPTNHPILLNAQHRGLIYNQPQTDLAASTLQRDGNPPHELYEESNKPSTSRAIHNCCDFRWTSSMHHQQQTTRPRLFLPYYETARVLLEKQLSESPEQLTSLINHHPPVSISNRVPVALYMVDLLSNECYGSNSASSSHNDLNSSEITIPDVEVLNSMKLRVEQILRSSSTVKRGLACSCSYHRHAVVKQVRLRSVREFGLNDNSLVLFKNSPKFNDCTLPERTASQLDHHDDYSNSGCYHYAPKRRFRSEPGLAQCDLTSSVSMEWPDLMASSSKCDGVSDYISWSAEASSRLSVLETSWATTSVDLDSSSSTNIFAAGPSPSKSEDASRSSGKEGPNIRRDPSVYQLVELAAQINEYVDQNERRDVQENRIPLDLTCHTSQGNS